MNRRWMSTIAIALLGVASVALVACGNNNDSSTTAAATTSTTASSSSSGGTADVSLADAGDLGRVLIGPDGKTLYLFDKDTSGDASTCSGACAAAWPPLTVKGNATAGDGVDASKLTTFKRDDGGTQVAYNGHPLYFYAGDAQPGDTNGNNLDQFGAEWYALTAAGDSVGAGAASSGDDMGSSSTTTTDTGSGYSY